MSGHWHKVYFKNNKKKARNRPEDALGIFLWYVCKMYNDCGDCTDWREWRNLRNRKDCGDWRLEKVKLAHWNLKARDGSAS